jgi:hypothetical protein
LLLSTLPPPTALCLSSSLPLPPLASFELAQQSPIPTSQHLERVGKLVQQHQRMLISTQVQKRPIGCFVVLRGSRFVSFPPSRSLCSSYCRQALSNVTQYSPHATRLSQSTSRSGRSTLDSLFLSQPCSPGRSATYVSIHCPPTPASHSLKYSSSLPSFRPPRHLFPRRVLLLLISKSRYGCAC